MFFEESSTRWLLILFEFIIGLILYFGSKSQPFPMPSRRLGMLLLTIASLLLIGQSAPRPASVNGHFIFLSIIGALGLIFGVHHMLKTRREVLVAPMSGFLFSVGVGGLMVQTWDTLNTMEQWSGFLALLVLSGGQVWLVFRAEGAFTILSKEYHRCRRPSAFQVAIASWKPDNRPHLPSTLY